MSGLPQEDMQERMNISVQEPCLVLQVVPPRANSSRDMAALETVMQGLPLDARHPIALEIARTENGRQFLLRATSRAALESSQPLNCDREPLPICRCVPFANANSRQKAQIPY